jgi:hypothetical protein
VDPDEARGTTPPWPPPHPSPPLPPPREYGAPGTPPDWRPWLGGLLAVLVAGALVTAGLLVLLPGSAEDDNSRAGRQPGESSSASDAGSTAPATPAPYRCWDGSDAQKLKDCSRPTGVEGLRWVFPAMADEKCGKPNTSGGAGLELRMLCLHRLQDGTRIGVGYFAWQSIPAGFAFYKGQGLQPSKVPGPDGRPVHFGFFGIEGATVKAASLFAKEPFSLTITYPATTTLSEQDQQALAPRPPDQVRGAPAG